MKSQGAPDGATLLAWMDRAISDIGDARLWRDGGDLKLDDGRLWWHAQTDERGQWYAHFSCSIWDDRPSPEPFWTQHQELYGETALREHVKAVVDSTRT